MSKEKIENGVNEAEETAAIEAASDYSAQAAEKDANDLNINDRLPYTVTLSKTYSFEGQEIDEIDLGGLEDLSTGDAEYVDRVMARMGHYPKNKFNDNTYAKHIAMRVTNLPIEFFNSLKWKDMQAITSRIAIYFLY